MVPLVALPLLFEVPTLLGAREIRAKQCDFLFDGVAPNAFHSLALVDAIDHRAAEHVGNRINPVPIQFLAGGGVEGLNLPVRKAELRVASAGPVALHVASARRSALLAAITGNCNAHRAAWGTATADRRDGVRARAHAVQGDPNAQLRLSSRGR